MKPVVDACHPSRGSGPTGHARVAARLSLTAVLMVSGWLPVAVSRAQPAPEAQTQQPGSAPAGGTAARAAPATATLPAAAATTSVPAAAVAGTAPGPAAAGAVRPVHRPAPGSAAAPSNALRALVDERRLQPGDAVVLACGGHWWGPLQIGASVPFLRIVAEEGCSPQARPQIHLVRPLPQPAPALAQIPLPEAPAAVWVQGRALEMARYPARGHLRTARAEPPRGAAPTTGLTLTQPLPTGPASWAGALVHVRSHGWLIESGVLTGAEGATLTATAVAEHGVKAGAPLTLAGLPWMLSQGREPGWAWEAERRRLWLRLPGGESAAGAPMALGWSAPVSGVAAGNAKGLWLEGFDVVGAGVDGIDCGGCTDATLRDLRILGAVRDGVRLQHSERAQVQNVTVQDVGRDGIEATMARQLEIRDSLLTRIGTGGWPHSSRAAIYGFGSVGLRVSDTAVVQAGYIGIRFHRQAEVKRNVLVHTCQALSDCGALYAWSLQFPLVDLRSVVEHNLVVGVPGENTLSPDGWPLAAGLYLDELTSGVLLRGNVVLDAERGLHLNNVYGNEIRDNLFAGSTGHSWVLDYKHPAAARLPVNVLAGNAVLHPDPATSAVLVVHRTHRPAADRLAGNRIVVAGANPWFQAMEGGAVTQLRRLARVGDPPSTTLPWLDLGQGPANRIWRGQAWPLWAGELAASAACPAPQESACGRLRDLAGEPLAWPVAVAPWSRDAAVLERP